MPITEFYLNLGNIAGGRPRNKMEVNRYIDNIRRWSYYIYAVLCAINWTVNSIIYMVKIYNNNRGCTY